MQKEDVTVLRRKSSYFGGFVVLLLVTGISAAGVAIGWEKNSTSDRTLFVAMSLLALRLIWRALIAPRIEIVAGKVHVIGFWDSSWIPLQCIRKLDTSSGLLVVTKGGGEIPVFAFSGSNIDRDRTVRNAAEKVRRAMTVHRQESRGAAVADEEPKRKVSLTLGDIFFLPFPILLTLGAFGLL
ncbi:hypothetical protein ACHZ98_34760 [Streptomyces sp. MAR4 CNY-716]